MLSGTSHRISIYDGAGNMLHANTCRCFLFVNSYLRLFPCWLVGLATTRKQWPPWTAYSKMDRGFGPGAGRRGKAIPSRKSVRRALHHQLHTESRRCSATRKSQGNRCFFNFHPNNKASPAKPPSSILKHPTRPPRESKAKHSQYLFSIDCAVATHETCLRDSANILRGGLVAHKLKCVNR